MQREMVDRQYRSFQLDEVEIRDAGTAGFTFEGVASTVDEPYTVRDRYGEFTEVIERGAFDKTLAELKKRATKGPKHDVGLFLNHDYKRMPLATVGSGRLELFADPNLRVRAQLNPDRSDVQDLRHAVNDGDMRQMSIGFDIPKGRNEWTADHVHRVREVKLFEASVVWLGANHLTSTSMRSVDDLLDGADVEALAPEEFRRLLDRLERRFAEVYAEDVRAQLRVALYARFAPGPSEYIWVRDFTDGEVIYERDGGGAGVFRLAYTLDAGGKVALADAAPEPVTPTTTYRSAASPSPCSPILLEWMDKRFAA